MAVGVIKEKIESVLYGLSESDTMQIVGENTLKAYSVPEIVEVETLGVIMQTEVVVEDRSNKEVICNYPERNLYGFCVPEILYHIADCESGLKTEVCNNENCGKGRGLFQLIKTTQELCQYELNKTIDPFSGRDSTECALWLYKNHGTEDWGHEGADWGSFECFKKYLK